VTLPDQLRRSLTWDHGEEMAEHVRFTIESGLPV
jgi:IS30 family transposase